MSVNAMHSANCQIIIAYFRAYDCQDIANISNQRLRWIFIKSSLYIQSTASCYEKGIYSQFSMSDYCFLTLILISSLPKLRRCQNILPLQKCTQNLFSILKCDSTTCIVLQIVNADSKSNSQCKCEKQALRIFRLDIITT